MLFAVVVFFSFHDMLVVVVEVWKRDIVCLSQGVLVFCVHSLMHFDLSRMKLFPHFGQGVFALFIGVFVVALVLGLLLLDSACMVNLGT